MLGATALVLLCTFGQTPDSGRFLRYTPLTLADLYEKRIRFHRREPLLSVGIMDGQPQVSLGATGPMRLMFDEGDLPKTAYGPGEGRFILKKLASKPAVLRHWVIVESKGPFERSAVEEALARYKKAGRETKIFEVGTVVSLKGNVLDTRQVELGVGGFPEREQAEALMRELAKEGSAQLFLHEELVALPSGTIGIFDEAGALLHKAIDAVYIGTTTGHQVRIAGVEFARGYKNHGREDRQYWGHVYVVIDQKGALAVVNSIGAERFLRGLVPAEIFAKSPLEALKAQAVTARGEIFSKLGHRHFGEPFHLCSEQHCQVYKGAGEEQPGPNQAVKETRGLLAVRPRQKADEPLTLVDSVYSSSCGGYSETNETVWGTPPSPSLRADVDGVKSDPALAAVRGGLDEKNLRGFLEAYPPVDCARASLAQPGRFRWKKTFKQAELDPIGESIGVGRLKDVAVLGRGPGGRVTGLKLVGVKGSLEVLRELPVRRLFQNLSSGLFVLDLSKNDKGEILSLTFTGGGWGHGVGMCQMGAIGRAERGQTFKQILEHYYGGAAVEEVY
ncbi:MAG: SpoIID/LytB domain-containing protein [Myxococcota bacterium]